MKNSGKILAVTILVLACHQALSAAIPANQRQALIDLYNATNGARWREKTKWLGAAGTENTWYGVVTDAGNTTVTRLNLNSNHLVGTLPSSLGNLNGLQYLYLNNNELSGSIPSSLGNLAGLLELGLFSNQLTGILPPEFGELDRLRKLFLHNNRLSGSIPVQIGGLAGLEYLWLAQNQLSGRIPDELGRLGNLISLKLGSNNLSGPIPAALSKLSKLQTLSLERNEFTGAIPDEIGDLATLQVLDLSGNQLTGALPPFLGGLFNLQNLSLSANDFTGSIPPELGDLANLTTLNLSYCKLTGSIPTSLCNLTGLQNLHLNDNGLTGSIPSMLHNMTGLRVLDLGRNRLSTGIPNELRHLRRLQTLNLAHNQLSGLIPEELGELAALKSLFLEANEFIGSIPLSFVNLTSLDSNETNIGYNALRASDASLIAFLDSKDPDWAATQTIFPTGVRATPGSASALVSWTPIAYSGDSGGYRVWFKPKSRPGPTAVFGQTSDKNATSMLVTGLTPGTTYSFAVQTRTEAHVNNLNTVDSETSTSVLATPLSAPFWINSPNGGESWVAGSSHNIVWTHPQTIANVKLEYSTNNGASWTTIVASMVNTGTFAWTVPSATSTGCLVRVSDAANPMIFDMSDATFTISAGVSVLVLSKTSLAFGAEQNATSTPAQTLILSNTGTGTLNWTAAPSADWLSVSPQSGAGSGALSIGIARTDLSPATYHGTVTVSDPAASNNPRTIAVSLQVYDPEADILPFGQFETPTGGTTVASSIAVTGWALDNIGIQSVKLYRGTGLADRAYIGDAVFIEGARPDVQAAFPEYPQSNRAGWGYTMPTNSLPLGDGPYNLLAYAADLEGREILLGEKPIIVANGAAVLPFGTIDTPAQGGTASGAAYFNSGWTLTPLPNSIPTNGSTITVWVDGLALGHPSYNHYRGDIAALFPGYANAGGAIGVFTLDTRAYTDGVHTIAWSVQDTGGNVDGIGSRYFTVQNAVTPAPGAASTAVRKLDGVYQDLSAADIHIRRGFDLSGPPERMRAEDGIPAIVIRELERVEVFLRPEAPAADGNRPLYAEGGLSPARRYEGYLVVGAELLPLPIGSSFDSEAGVFAWIPGPGFLGDYRLAILDNLTRNRISLTIRIEPRFR